MKKIFSLAMMAVMALGAAVTTVSCTNNDDVAPAVDTKVNLAAGVNSDAISYNCEKELFAALTNFYQGKVGSTGTVRYANTSGEYNLYFTTTKANLNAFKQALKNITDDETNAVVKNFKFNWLNITVTDGNEAVLKYNCEKVQKDEVQKVETKYYAVEAGSWTATLRGVTYTVEFTSEKVGDHEYKAYLHIGDKVYPGKAVNVNNKNLGFTSDEKVESVPVYSAALGGDSIQPTMTAVITCGILPVAAGQFTKK